MDLPGRLTGMYAFEDVNDAAEDSEKGTTLHPVLTFG